MEHSDPYPDASDTEASSTARPRETPLLRQFGNSGMAEITAFAVAIGAVYATERLFPHQTQAFVSRLAEKLGEWRGKDTATQQALAKKIVDVTIMNLGGAASLGVQFGLRRAQQKEEGGEKTPLLYEAGRLAAGRILGTATAIGTLALMETRAPGIMKQAESGVSRLFGASPKSDRFAALAVSDAVQSVGATLGNAPAQVLYDHLVGTPEKNQGKS